MHTDDSIVSLAVDAAGEAEAADYARAQGYSVIRVSRRSPWQIPLADRAGRFSVLLFSQELLALLAAGLSLIEALEALKNRKHRHSEAVIEGIVAALSEGQTFSAAISRHPRHFSPLYVASMQAAERTGDLAEALRRYVEYQQQMDKVRKRLVSASMYPALLTAVGALVVLFLLLYVVPRFSRVYEGFSGELPFFSRMLVAVGGFISSYGWLLALLVAALLVAGALAVTTPALRAKIGAGLRSLPAVAEQVRLYQLTRLYRSLGMLLNGGIPVTRAHGMVAPLLGGPARASLDRATQWITEGRSISFAMEEAGLTTPVAARMLLVGERTGDMGSMMVRVAEFHEEDLSRWLEDFSKLFEPLLMLAIGLAVGGIVVLMYMPIFELATAIQ
ncbi:MAG: type II secretion system F family protein [Rhodocyclales bacterium]|nr:type II secretion system F family protein [Rhodocyclales bacterium]